MQQDSQSNLQIPNCRLIFDRMDLRFHFHFAQFFLSSPFVLFCQLCHFLHSSHFMHTWLQLNTRYTCCIMAMFCYLFFFSFVCICIFFWSPTPQQKCWLSCCTFNSFEQCEICCMFGQTKNKKNGNEQIWQRIPLHAVLLVIFPFFLSFCLFLFFLSLPLTFFRSIQRYKYIKLMTASSNTWNDS